MLRITLFGKLCVRYGEGELDGCHSLKVQELFSYLLLNRDRPHAREMLASLLWGDHCTTSQSRKYLRNTLWQLQAALNHHPELSTSGLLLVEPDWIQLRTAAVLWLDVAVFETAYAAVKGMSGRNLNDQTAQDLELVVRLYRGHLLETWHQDWCLCERERLLQVYLIMLDKLTEYCEAYCEYERGLSYGRRILQHDQARERTHRQMMRLYYLAGNRSCALRQYERCVVALREELDVEPAQSTVALYEQIRADRLYQPAAMLITEDAAVREALICLRELQAGLREAQQLVQQATEALGLALSNRHQSSRRPKEGEGRR